MQIKRYISQSDMVKNRVSVYNAGVVESTSGVTIVDAHREKQNIYLEYAPTIYALTAAIDAKDQLYFYPF